MIQLREKHMDRGSILAQALELRELCGRYGVPLILNDDAELAQAAGADGVHVGQSDMEAGRVPGPAGGRQTHRRVRTHGGAGPGRPGGGGRLPGGRSHVPHRDQAGHPTSEL